MQITPTVEQGIAGKICSRCNQWKELSAYSPNPRSADKHKYKCKKCNSEQAMERYYANHGAEKVKALEKYHANRPANIERMRKRRQEKGCWSQEHPELAQAYQKKYRKDNAGRLRQLASQWRERNRDKDRDYHRAWRNNNLERARFLSRRNQKIRTRRVAAAEGYFTPEEWVDLCTRYGHKCLRCGKGGKLTIDHIIPYSKGGTNWINNIQSLCSRCNSIKGTKTTDYRPMTVPS